MHNLGEKIQICISKQSFAQNYIFALMLQTPKVAILAIFGGCLILKRWF